MSTRYVVHSGDLFLTARRPTGRVYEARSGWSASLDDAKVFASVGAATTSARHNGEHPDFQVCKVLLVLAESD